MDNPFLELIEKHGGFEYTIGFRDNEDHWIGGTGNTVWYLISKGRSQECWIGERSGETWTDRHLVKKKTLTEKPAEPGTTMEMILARAYFKHAEIAASGRKPVPTEFYGHPCSHYVFSFGARAYDISDEFGITMSYSNIDEVTAGYRLRDVGTGAGVTVPQL